MIYGTDGNKKHRDIGVVVGMQGSGSAVCTRVSSAEQYSHSKSNKSVFTATGMALSVAAGRLSYVNRLTGFCLTLDTACSSFLVSMNVASK